MAASLSKADELMKKASEHFAGGKLQKAHQAYGQALALYDAGNPVSRERMALAHYTRALLVLKGKAVGDVAEDLDAGDVLCSAGDFGEARRFQGLFLYLRAVWRRQYDEVDEAQVLLDAAREHLALVGRPLDLYELEVEQLELAADRKDREAGERAARAALDRAASPRHVFAVKLRLAQFHEQANRPVDALRVLEEAAGRAYDSELKEQLWDVQARIKNLRARFPELPPDPVEKAE